MNLYPAPAGGGGGISSIANVSAQLGADVAIATPGTFVDGPTISLTAGKWLIIAYASIVCASGTGFSIARIWDGTTVYASQESSAQSSTKPAAFCMAVVVNLAAGATLRFSATVTSLTGTIKAATVDSGQGNNASGIVAIGPLT